MDFEIIYEDNHLLAVNKPSGLLVQGDHTGDKALVDYGKEYLKEKYQKPGEVFLGVVHRLDRPVSGVVVLARTSKALSRMNQLFREQKVKKVYQALTDHKPNPTSGELIHWLVKDPKKNKATAYAHQVPESKQAILNYKLLGKGKPYRLEVYPSTGRPHQIRVQLASIGCLIIGDLKYGYPKPNRDQSISLHAKSLTFVHPVKKEPLVLEAIPPF